MSFLFWLFFVGIGIASLQDLKRREVDNWLNLFLVVSSFAFIFFTAIFNLDGSIVVFASVSLLITFVLANLFYYGRVFAGGDAKLLFVMAALFVGSTFVETVSNIGFFVILLMVSGSIYGLGWGIVLFVKNFKKIKLDAKKQTENIYFRYFVFSGIVLFVLSFVDILFLFFSVFVFIGCILWVFAKAVENCSMIKFVNGKNLREGDWLAEDIKLGKKTFKANWEGLDKNDLKILNKSKRKFKIKEGLPFVPAFFIALILYFFKERIIDLILLNL